MDNSHVANMCSRDQPYEEVALSGIPLGEIDVLFGVRDGAMDVVTYGG